MKRSTNFKVRLVLALILVAVMTASVAGCATPTATAAPTATPGSSLLDGGVTNPTGYDPIVNTPITLKASVIYGAQLGDITKYEIWKTIEDRTGIKIELDVLSDIEKVNLMFASRQFPDIGFRMDPNNSLVMDAADAGDLVNLSPMIDQYAPIWAKFFKDNPTMSKYVQMKDGNLYSLPYVDWLEWQINLRDQWFINSNWLTELGLKEPKTTAEFKEYLVQVKANAGKGTIPANVIPFNIQYNNWIGGQFDVYASFGVYTCQTNAKADYLYLNNGKIASQVGNPNLKAAIKYLADLYQSGLMSPSIFTDDFGASFAKVTSNPAVAGSLGTHNTNNMPWWKAIGPLDSGEGRPSYIRAQSKGVRLNAFMIFKGNKYPVASLRLANMLSDPEGLLVDEYMGYEGVQYTKTGNYFSKNSIVDMAKAGDNLKPLSNYLITLVDQNVVDKYFKFPAIYTPGTREYEYYNRYKKAAPLDMQIPSIPDAFYTDSERQLLTQYATDCDAYMNKTVAKWITGETDIEAGFGKLQSDLDAMGYSDYIALLQKGYDQLIK